MRRDFWAIVDGRGGSVYEDEEYRSMVFSLRSAAREYKAELDPTEYPNACVEKVEIR